MFSSFVRREMGLSRDENDRPVGETNYEFLVGRAVAFAREQGGTVREEALIGHVFGSGNTTLWGSLLRRILAGSPDLTQRADGVWSVYVEGEEPAAATFLSDFIAVDLETTGLGPLKHRVIEVACIRYTDGVEVATYQTLINPERPVSAFIAKLTGITSEMVADAPKFIDVAGEIVEFIGETTLLGHNVGFDIGFLNGELKRLGRPPLINGRMDTKSLAMKVLPALRRPNLENVAKTLGLDGRKFHRATGDARLAAAAAFKLEGIARAGGPLSAERFRALTAEVGKRTKDEIGRGRAVLDRSIMADVPRKPGVYIMRDAYDRVIYIGKAKNLRDRVSSYFSQPLGYRRKMDGLLESLSRLDVEVTGCELDALLLESQLIRRYQPRYNTALRSSELYPFIRVDLANPWPRVTLAKARKEDGARYFGPFKSQKSASATVDLLNSHFRLRTCPRSFKNARSYGSPCLQLDLGRCPGPCVGKANRDDYMREVRRAVAFLDGDDEVMLGQIQASLEGAAERLDFERARQLRNDLRQLASIAGAQRAIRQAEDRHHAVVVLPSVEADGVELLLVARGGIWSRHRYGDGDCREEMAGRLARSWERWRERRAAAIDHNAVDESSILNRWLARNWGAPYILALDAEGAVGEIDWREVVEMALSVSIDSTVGDVTRADARGVSVDDGLEMNEEVVEVEADAGVGVMVVVGDGELGVGV